MGSPRLKSSQIALLVYVGGRRAGMWPKEAVPKKSPQLRRFPFVAVALAPERVPAHPERPKGAVHVRIRAPRQGGRRSGRGIWRGLLWKDAEDFRARGDRRWRPRRAAVLPSRRRRPREGTCNKEIFGRCASCYHLRLQRAECIIRVGSTARGVPAPAREQARGGT